MMLKKSPMDDCTEIPHERNAQESARITITNNNGIVDTTRHANPLFFLKKEASPEECDEAVEDLTMAKAKAKSKQLQDSQISIKAVVKKIWAVLLGIGPALRAVASMSRLKLYFIPVQQIDSALYLFLKSLFHLF